MNGQLKADLVYALFVALVAALVVGAAVAAIRGK